MLHPDGSHRLLYCVESPESWFEDFGKGTLECGRAEVALDPDFAVIVDLSDYHVFLTAYDHEHALHIRNQTPSGFTVEADAALARLKGQKESDLTGRFSWRVVAKRKDIEAKRLAPATMPPEPTLPDLPARPPLGAIVLSRLLEPRTNGVPEAVVHAGQLHPAAIHEQDGRRVHPSDSSTRQSPPPDTCAAPSRLVTINASSLI